MEIRLAYKSIFDKSISTFIIRISGKTTEQDVIDCFQNFDKIVEKNFERQRFSIIINVDEEAHSSIAVLRRIRSSLENQKYREYIANIVAVNENPLTVAARNANSDNLLRFFLNEAEAKQYIAAKIQNK
jgi:hypothetical protein